MNPARLSVFIQHIPKERDILFSGRQFHDKSLISSIFSCSSMTIAIAGAEDNRKISPNPQHPSGEIQPGHTRQGMTGDYCIEPSRQALIPPSRSKAGMAILTTGSGMVWGCRYNRPLGFPWFTLYLPATVIARVEATEIGVYPG